MSNQRSFKRPRRRLLPGGIVAALCAGVFLISFITSCTPSASQPTLRPDEIATAAFQTAVVLNQQTRAAYSPTATYTSSPTTTNTPPPTFPPTDTPFPPTLPTATSVAIPVTGNPCIPDNPPQTGKVVQVIDGDTIKVLLDQDGRTYTVRYIGIDTPENTSQVEFFGPEATAKNTALVYGKTITMFKDVSEIDPYGRLLRYVIAENIFVNHELVALGYANTASYPPDLACIETFLAAEQRASASKLGFWSDSPTPVP